LPFLCNFINFHQITCWVVEHHPPGESICFHSPGQVDTLVSKFTDGFIQFRSRKSNYRETGLGVWRESGVAGDDRQNTATQVKVWTVTRVVRNHLQPNHIPVKMSRGGHICCPETYYSNVNVHMNSF